VQIIPFRRILVIGCAFVDTPKTGDGRGVILALTLLPASSLGGFVRAVRRRDEEQRGEAFGWTRSKLVRSLTISRALEYAFAGRLDVSECDHVVVHQMSLDHEGVITAADPDASLETVVSLSFQGEVVF
jgi:hypothetical protein